MRRKEDGSLYGIGGMDFHLLQILSTFYPFGYELMNRTDRVFGSFNDGEWTGIMGMLKNGEADMVVNRMAQTPVRMQGGDFSFPYILDSISFLTAAPGVKIGDFPFIEPFYIMVWCFLLLSLPISSATVYLLSLSRRHKETSVSGWMHESYKLIALLVGQGSYASYQKTRVQVFMYHWSLSKLVLVFSYCSILLSFLMVPRMDTPLRTVQELKEAVISGKYQFSTFEGTSLMANLLDTKTGVFKVLGDHLREHPENALKPKDNAFLKVLTKQRLAVLMPRYYFTYAASEYASIDRFHMPDDNFAPIALCVVMRKGTGMLERINRLIHRVTQAGLYSKQLEDLAFRRRIKYAKPAPPVIKRSLSFTDMQTAVQLLAAGLLVSTFCLIGEIFIHKRQTSRKNRKGRENKSF